MFLRARRVFFLFCLASCFLNSIKKNFFPKAFKPMLCCVPEMSHFLLKLPMGQRDRPGMPGR